MNRLLALVEQYGIFGLIRLFFDKMRSFTISKKAKLIRFPFEIRGKRGILIGEGFTTGRYCRIEAYPICSNKRVLTIGINCQINDSVHIVARESVYIGDNVLIASKVFITDLNHGCYNSLDEHSEPDSIVSSRPLNSSPVLINDNCWIGENVSILPGVTLGKNCIVGANSLVTKSFESNCIVVGNPARLLKRYCESSKRWVSIKS
jgi:acetyltransferase-like isoleucine patch superfamily enzyme